MEKISIYVPIITILLALLNQIVTFVLARLKEAETPEDKAWIWRRIFGVIGLLILATSLVGMYLHNYTLATICMTLSFALSWGEYGLASDSRKIELTQGLVLSSLMLSVMFILASSESHTAASRGIIETCDKLEKRIKTLEDATATRSPD